MAQFGIRSSSIELWLIIAIILLVANLVFTFDLMNEIKSIYSIMSKLVDNDLELINLIKKLSP